MNVGVFLVAITINTGCFPKQCQLIGLIMDKDHVLCEVGKEILKFETVVRQGCYLSPILFNSFCKYLT